LWGGGLEDTTDDPLESFGGDFTALEVRETYEYLDGATVQHGLAAGDVETTVEDVHIDGATIDIDRHGSRTRTHTEWVADVQDAGFVAAERTSDRFTPAGTVEGNVQCPSLTRSPVSRSIGRQH